jgi:hypothetical protein
MVLHLPLERFSDMLALTTLSLSDKEIVPIHYRRLVAPHGRRKVPVIQQNNKPEQSRTEQLEQPAMHKFIVSTPPK